MYTVGVQDHIKVAHSLQGEQFGAAARLHGVTYTVKVEIEREELDDDGVVCEMAFVQRRLREVLSDLDRRNLDEHPAFTDRPSTAEMLARFIHKELGKTLPVPGGGTLKVTLVEAPDAWAAYRAPLPTETTPPHLA